MCGNANKSKHNARQLFGENTVFCTVCTTLTKNGDPVTNLITERDTEDQVENTKKNASVCSNIVCFFEWIKL